MIIRSSTRISVLVAHHQDAPDVLNWYGVRSPSSYAHLSIGELCEQFDVELEDLLYDLRAMDGDDLDDEDDDDDWDDDDWEDGDDVLHQVDFGDDDDEDDAPDDGVRPAWRRVG